MSELHLVTGAFGYSGRRIAERLLAEGHRVRTLTHSRARQSSLAEQIEVFPYRFDSTNLLAKSLDGVKVLYNTYWVRFNHRNFNHSQAVENTKMLFNAARMAGVSRIVHVSITNPSENSPLEYFRGKAVLERCLAETGNPHTIVRPAVLFGGEDILINNIAWSLRRFPLFGVFGDGSYRLQPIHVGDFADLIVREGKQSGNSVIDAIGPETFTFRGLVEEIGAAIGKQRRIISLSPTIGYWACWCIGLVMRDVLLTRDEIKGLMDNLLYTDSQPAGQTRLSDWARSNADTLGLEYASELARRS
ncbi:MAG: hypothetical protein GHCLOJNM_01500 [bacterium]|nr:hypothetical protein [bacterium]